MNKPRLTDPEIEMLVILIEECSELQKVASKMIRFGRDSEKTEQLAEEIGDIQCMIDLLHEFDLVSFNEIDERVQIKKEKLREYSNIFLT